MRKNRNSFFTETGMNYSNFQNTNIPFFPNQTMYQNPYVNNNDYDSRIARIERQINRLNARVNKLENINTTYLDNENDISGNIYML